LEKSLTELFWVGRTPLMGRVGFQDTNALSTTFTARNSGRGGEGSYVVYI
jgi:hypothetical protein